MLHATYITVVAMECCCYCCWCFSLQPNITCTLAQCEMYFSNRKSLMESNIELWVNNGNLFSDFTAPNRKITPRERTAYVQTTMLILCEIKHFDFPASGHQWCFFVRLLFIIKLHFNHAIVYHWILTIGLLNLYLCTTHKKMNNYLYAIMHIHGRHFSIADFHATVFFVVVVSYDE